MWVGVVLRLSACLCACLWVRPVDGVRVVVVVVMVWEVGGTQHSEGGRGGGRWKSEQNNLAQWESKCGGARGSRVGPECEQGLRLSRKQ